MIDVSIITTVKNGENTIRHTIDSVINQIMTNWEFIIVDDGSTDNTLKIIQMYADGDSRIKVISTEGIGRGFALNLAIKHSSAKFITNLDADDVIHPNKLGIQYNFMTKNKNFFLISTNSVIIYSNDSPKWREINANNTNVIRLNEKNLKKNQINHSSVMYKKEDIINIGGYQNIRKSQYDYELWLRADAKGYNLGKLSLPLVAKRVHKNQSFESKRVGQLTRSVLLQSKYILISKKIYLLIYPIGRLMLGVLPFNLRQKINKKLNL